MVPVNLNIGLSNLGLGFCICVVVLAIFFIIFRLRQIPILLRLCLNLQQYIRLDCLLDLRLPRRLTSETSGSSGA